MPACACGHHHHAPEGCARPGPVGTQVALSGQIACADAGQLMALLMHVQSHVADSRAEPGCLHFDIAQTDDPLTWQVEALFRDRSALTAHRTRTGAGEWAAATAGIAQYIHEIAPGQELPTSAKG